MEGRYIKLDPEYVYNLRRELKSYDDFFNNVLRNIRSYKLLRKKEVALKNKLKIEITALKTKMNSAEQTLPKEERDSLKNSMPRSTPLIHNTINNSEVIQHHYKSAKMPAKRQEKTSSHKTSIDRDLEEIRDKLSKFEK